MKTETYKKLMGNKLPYMAPQLEVTMFKAERGYASSILRMLALSQIFSASGSVELEGRQNVGNWGNSEGWF